MKNKSEYVNQITRDTANLMMNSINEIIMSCGISKDDYQIEWRETTYGVPIVKYIVFRNTALNNILYKLLGKLKEFLECEDFNIDCVGWSAYSTFCELQITPVY